jgi:hypothetical protein
MFITIVVIVVLALILGAIDTNDASKAAMRDHDWTMRDHDWRS